MKFGSQYLNTDFPNGAFIQQKSHLYGQPKDVYNDANGFLSLLLVMEK